MASKHGPETLCAPDGSGFVVTDSTGPIYEGSRAPQADGCRRHSVPAMGVAGTVRVAVDPARLQARCEGTPPVELKRVECAAGQRISAPRKLVGTMVLPEPDDGRVSQAAADTASASRLLGPKTFTPGQPADRRLSVPPYLAPSWSTTKWRTNGSRMSRRRHGCKCPPAHCNGGLPTVATRHDGGQMTDASRFWFPMSPPRQVTERVVNACAFLKGPVVGVFHKIPLCPGI